VKATTETRSGEIVEVRQTADGGHEADIRIVKYGVVDSYKTRFMPGVFKRQVAEGQIASVWAHQVDRPIGVVTDFRDSSEALDGTLKFLPFEDCPDARLAWSSMKAGAIKGISFGFERLADERNAQQSEVRDITDANLSEASPVLSPAVPGAKVLAVRSDASAEMPEKDAAAVIRWFADATDEERSKFLALLPETREDEHAATHEFRALVDTPDIDPMQVLSDINGHVAKLHEALDADDLHKAKNFFQQAADKLRTLQYAVGVKPSALAAGTYSDYAAPEGEVREDDTVVETVEEPDEFPAELLGPDADEDVLSGLDALTRGKNPKMPYGNVSYADPGYQADKKKRYPLTADKVQAAWSYINQDKNQTPYTSAQLASIKGKIKTAMTKFGHKVNDGGTA
jgi:HK97 family phage prohead protease